MDDLVAPHAVQKLVILCGLQRTGKTTWRKQMLPFHTSVCFDAIVSAIGRGLDQQSMQFAGMVAYTMAGTLILEGHNVVIDHVNGTWALRQNFVNLVKEGECDCVHFQRTPFESSPFQDYSRRMFEPPSADPCKYGQIIEI